MAEHLRDLWNFEDAVTSEQKFDDYYATLPDHETVERALVLTQKGRARGLQRRFDEARETLRDAKALCPSDAKKVEGWYEIEIGRVENSSGNKDAAREHFLRALKIGQEEGLDSLAIDAAHMLGIVDKGQASLDWNEEAIRMAENSSEPRARNWLGSLLNNTGWTYYDLGNYAKAMELFEKAVVFRKEAGKEPAIRIARYCVGKCHRAMGHLETALELQLELEKEGLAAGDKPGYTFEEIAECLLALGREEEARPYFARAHKVLSKDEWLMTEEPERVERLRKMAEGSLGSEGA